MEIVSKLFSLAGGFVLPPGVEPVLPPGVLPPPGVPGFDKYYCVVRLE